MKHNLLKSSLFLMLIATAGQVFAGTVDLLTSGLSNHSWNNGSYNSSSKEISFSNIGYDTQWGAWGWGQDISASTSDWDQLVAIFNESWDSDRGLQYIGTNGNEAQWVDIKGKQAGILDFVTNGQPKEVYFKTDNRWGYRTITLKSVTAYTRNTIPCTLSFFYDESGKYGSSDKAILNSDFSYDKNTDDVKRDRSSYSQINLKYGVTATSRARVNFSEAGTYIFTFPYYASENGSYDMPRVTINGVQSTATNSSLTAGDGSYEATVTVASAGNYSVQVYWGNTNEKLYFSTVRITKQVSIPTNTYIFGNVDGYSWNATQGTALTYNSTTQLFTKVVNITGSFGFSEVLANNNDNGGWEYVNNYRWGASSDETTASVGSSNWNSLVKRTGSDNNYSISTTGRYFVTVDWVNSRFSLAPLYTVSYSAGANGSVSAEVSGSAISNNAEVASGETVTFTASPNSGYKVTDWTVNGVSQGVTATTLDVVISAITSVSVSFEIRLCDNTKIIACVDYDNSTIPSGSGNNTPSNIQTNSNYYDITGDFIDFKDSNGEIFFPVHLSAATYSFTIYHANGNNKWFNLYNSSGSKIHYYELGDNYSSSVKSKTTDSWALSDGDYYIGLYGEGWVSFEKIVINASEDVFCSQRDLYIIGQTNLTSYTWSANDDGGLMTYYPEDDQYRVKAWIGSGTNYATAGQFAFTTQIGSSSDDWATINANDYRPTSNKAISTTEACGSTNITLNRNYDYRNNNFTVPWAGYYTVIVSGDLSSFTIEGPELYYIGSSNGTWTDWGTSTNTGQKMTHDLTNNKYTLTTQIYNDDDAFAFTTYQAVGTDWSYINANRFGPSTNNAYVVTTGATNAMGVNGEKAFKVATSGQYQIEVNLSNTGSNQQTVKMQRVGSLTLNDVGSGTSSSDQPDNNNIVSGTLVTITATPNLQFPFRGWIVVSGDVVLADPTSNTTTFTMPDEDVEITASYGYVVNYEVVGGNGTISSVVDGLDNAVTNGQRVQANTQLTLTASPSSGYGVEGWYTYVDPTETLQDDTKGQSTFEYIVTSDITIRVRFSTAYTLTVTASPAAGGTVTGGGRYVAGQVVTVTATPNSGYAFQSWTHSGYQQSLSASFEYTMPEANSILQANFNALTCSASYTIQCETDYLPTFTLPTDIEMHTDGDGSGTDLYYRGYHGTGYAAYKDHGGDLYYYINIPQSGEYRITVTLTDGSNRWLNVFSTNSTSYQHISYGGVTYYKISQDGDDMGNGSDQAFQTYSTTKMLNAGSYIIGVWAEDCYAAFDQIVVSRTDNSQVFCDQIQDYYLIGNIYGTDYAWNPNPGAHEGRMTRQGDGTYTIRTSIANTGSTPYTGGTFAFSTVEGTWDEVNAHRFGPSSATEATENSGHYAFSAQNNDNAWSVPFAGTYTITLNPKTSSFTIEGPELYLFGTNAATNYTTASNRGLQMTYNSAKGKYIAYTTIAGNSSVNTNGYAAFTTGALDTPENWSYINNLRYGPSTDNTVPSTDGSNNAIGANGGKGFSVPAGYYEVTVNSSLTQAAFRLTCPARVYDIWTGSVAVSEDYHGKGIVAADTTITSSSQNYWLNQVVLGPEHFQTAAVGDTLFVEYTDITTDPKGALQSTKTYNALPGKAYSTANDAEVSYDNNQGLKDFYLPDNGYYHLLTAASLDSLKNSGVIVKGKGHTITKVSLHATCDNTSLRTTAPDITTVPTSLDLRSNPYVVGGAGFNLGVWEHKLEFPKEVFRSVEVGDYINVYVTSSAGTLISFRCNVPYILADDQNGKVCPSYGDISFDRTINNLDGDNPVVIGENSYAIITMEVNADMLARLNETGFIIAGKGSIVSRVESVAEQIVLGSVNTTESTRIPTVVNHLTIWQGSEATNTDDIEVRGSITYIRPAVGGMHGNVLNKWYTFCLPFSLQKVEVYDETDKRWYDGMQSIYRTSPSEGSDPQGYGYYYLNWLNFDNVTGLGDVFRARWDYVDSSTSDAKTSADGSYTGSRYGYARKDFPYIIMFTDWDGSDYYFRDNPTIRFVGGPQVITGSDEQVKHVGDGSQYYYYVNNTLTTMEFSSVYTLNETDNTFYLRDNARVAPFECYIQATDGFKASYKAIAFNLRPIKQDDGGVTTGIENELLLNGNLLQSLADRDIDIYDVSGRLVQHIAAGAGEVIQLDLPQGAYLIHSAGQTMKIML